MNLYRSIKDAVRSAGQTAQKVFSVLTAVQRRQFKKFVVLMFANSLFETMTLGLFIPIFRYVLDPEILMRHLPGKLAAMAGDPSSWQRNLTILAAGMIALFAAKNWIGFSLISRYNRFAFDLAGDISQRKLKEYFQLEYIGQQKTAASELLRLIAYVPIEFSQHIILGSMTLLSEGMVVLFFSAVIVLYDRMIFCAIIVVVLPYIAVTRLYTSKKLAAVKENVQQIHAKNLNLLSDSLKGYIDAVMYGSQQYFLDRTRAVQNELNGHMAVLNSMNTLPAKLSEIFLVAGFLIIMILASAAGRLPASGVLTGFALFLMYAYRVVPSVNKMLTVWAHLHTYAFTIDAAAGGEISSGEGSAGGKRPAFRRAIVLKNISFTYPGRKNPLYHNASVVIPKGKVIGLVGRSGGGKTTLLMNLLRAVPPVKGQILIDGVTADGIGPADWRMLFSFVQQDPFMLNDSIAANVAFGVPPHLIDSKKVSEVLDHAGLHDFVNELPDGISTILGENGKQISGGQKQRVVIARALYREAPVIVFDEPTSGLDKNAEEEFLALVRRLQRNKKTVMIASHRRSTISVCSILYEIKNGSIIRTENPRRNK